MKTIKTTALVMTALFFSTIANAQMSDTYRKSAQEFYKAAATTKCPERARVLNQKGDWCQCMVDVLAGKKTSCPQDPNSPIPDCPGDMMGAGGGTGTSTTNAPVTSYQNTDELANSLQGVIEGVSELAKMDLEDNAKANDWLLVSGGLNLDGGSGPLAGTSSDMGKTAGYYFSAQALSRKGISILSSFTSLKSKYFHSFRAKATDGQYYSYIGSTNIEMPVLEFSLGKDLTGTSNGSFHFVPNIGVDLIWGIENEFTSRKDPDITYTEEWEKDMFLAVHGGVQMFYLFSKRLGLQGGGKYLYFPSETGTVFKTAGFFHFNAGVSVRLF